MNLPDTIKEIIRTLKYSKKSDTEQFSLYLKLVFLGIAVVGGIAFVIHLVASLIMPGLTAQAILYRLMS
ncbi:MAG: protein translocase SEC61 complex subunit gamma [Nitrososphaerota archaeon]